MNNTHNNPHREDGPALPGRRQMLQSGIALAAASLLSYKAVLTEAASTTEATSTPGPLDATLSGRRRLGSLEVSNVGLGVQNMSRSYQTTIPTRSEMLNIIRTAFDPGVTFFDAAEAYGPHEVERILGEGVESFRDEVAIASKFGCDIDLETGAWHRGLNSRPEHMKLAVEGMLSSSACAPIASISSTSIWSTRRCRSKMGPARLRS